VTRPAVNVPKTPSIQEPYYKIAIFEELAHFSNPLYLPIPSVQCEAVWWISRSAYSQLWLFYRHRHSQHQHQRCISEDTATALVARLLLQSCKAFVMFGEFHTDARHDRGGGVAGITGAVSTCIMSSKSFKHLSYANISRVISC
jgi:hypothetical protein